MFLDVAYVARSLLRKMGHSPQVFGVLLVPPVDKSSASVPALANTFAALTELNYFSYPDVVFSARYETGEANGNKHFVEKGAAFQRCMLVPNQRSSEGTMTKVDVPTRTAHLLFCDLFTALGRSTEESRRERWGGLAPQNTTFHAFGTY